MKQFNIEKVWSESHKQWPTQQEPFANLNSQIALILTVWTKGTITDVLKK